VSARAAAAVALIVLAACGEDARFGAPDGGLPNGPGGSGGASGTGGAGAGPVVAGPIISENPIANWEAETHLAVAPDGRIFAVWIAIQLGHRKLIGYAHSSDGGATWAQAGVVPSDPDADAVDPAVAVDTNGIFHLTWLELPSVGPRRVETAAYIDSGDVFSVPVELTDPQASGDWDKPWIVALDGGALLAAWGTESGSSLVVAASPDGQSWQRAAFAPDGTLRNVVVPCFAGQGRVYLPYLVPGGVELVRSDDGGVTFTKPVRVDAPDAPAAFEAPSCAASGDEVWVLHGTSPTGADELHTPLLDHIVVAHSKDGGATFPDHAAIGDPAGPGSLLPFLSRSPDGRLDAVYYRGKADGDPHAALRWAQSSDGVAWSAPVTLHSPMLLETARDDFGWLGDYIGVRSEADGVYVTFADNASGPGTLSHVRFGKAMAKSP
jgi:hypothetical protein